MNVSYRWLKALRSGSSLSPEEVAEALALRGAPVEGILPLAPGLEGLLVGSVASVVSHPEAHHLTICTVDAGGESFQVVCGAPNVEPGGRYPFAPPGSRLPDGTEIGRARIRGVESAGMLCSEAELEMGPDGSGLLTLARDLTPGQPLADALGLNDWRLDVEVTANRGDLLSHLGLARELAAAGDGELGLEPVPGAPALEWRLLSDQALASTGGVSVAIQDPDLCSRYLGAVVRGVRVGPSPAWLASRIRAAGSRPINNVVDATNYVLMELGQPLHAFDLAKLGGSAIVVRRAREGELIRTLDGVDRRLTPDMLAICDASDPVAIAGVMGGLDSEVTEATTDLLLECALFHPGSIRATRGALDMSTDASYRFERGVDPEGMERAVRRAVEIILATGGGALDPSVLDVSPRPWEGLVVPLRPHRVQRFLGISLGKEEMEDLLRPLGFTVAASTGSELQIRVPGFRSHDVLREVDLLEEVARTYGYDRFPEDLGPFRPGSVPDHPLFALEDEIRDLMVGEGYLEAQTMAFAPEGRGEVELNNPVSVQDAWLRTSLLPGLLRRAEHNFARGRRDIRLFELGTVFLSRGPGEAPREETHLSAVVTGGRAPMHWQGEPDAVDLWDVKALLERLLPLGRLEGAGLMDGAPAGADLLPEEGFTVAGPGGGILGWGGRVRPESVDAPAWAAPVWGLELVLPAEPPPRSPHRYQPLPVFPGVDRDLALLVGKDLKAREVEGVIKLAAGPLLAHVRIFDLYEGKGIPEGYRSLAFRLRFQSDRRTLTDEEVEERVRAVMDRLREELGVEARA
jgi:phenylalanyl-tRNA synthetase beta chain